jgi:hypothetical protein
LVYFRREALSLGKKGTLQLEKRTLVWWDGRTHIIKRWATPSFSSPEHSHPTTPSSLGLPLTYKPSKYDISNYITLWVETKDVILSRVDCTLYFLKI